MTKRRSFDFAQDDTPTFQNSELLRELQAPRINEAW